MPDPNKPIEIHTISGGAELKETPAGGDLPAAPTRPTVKKKTANKGEEKGS